MQTLTYTSILMNARMYTLPNDYLRNTESTHHLKIDEVTTGAS